MLGVLDYWSYYHCVADGGDFKRYVLRRKKKEVMMIDKIELQQNESIRISTIETYVTLIPIGGTIKLYAGTGWDNYLGVLDSLEMMSLPAGSGDYTIVADENNNDKVTLLVVRYYLI
jgi:hypothetical protein